MGMQHFRKKTIELDQKSVDRLRIIFNVSTDKEAVNRAIQLVSQEDKIIQTHQEVAGKIHLRDIFE